MRTTDPRKRNLSADSQIAELNKRKSEYIRERSEKQLELDALNSDISLIEAQIANILMVKRRMQK